MGFSSLAAALARPRAAFAAEGDDAVAPVVVSAEPAKCRECAGTGVTPCDM